MAPVLINRTNRPNMPVQNAFTFNAVEWMRLHVNFQRCLLFPNCPMKSSLNSSANPIQKSKGSIKGSHRISERAASYRMSVLYSVLQTYYRHITDIRERMLFLVCSDSQLRFSSHLELFRRFASLDLSSLSLQVVSYNYSHPYL